MCPEVRMAPRSFRERPKTLDVGRAILSSSPSVLTNRRRGEEPCTLSLGPVRQVEASATLATFPFVSFLQISSIMKGVRSYHSLPMMPLTEGVAPLRKGGVADGSHGGILREMCVSKYSAVVQERRQTTCIGPLEALKIVVAELIHDDGQDQLGLFFFGPGETGPD